MKPPTIVEKQNSANSALTTHTPPLADSYVSRPNMASDGTVYHPVHSESLDGATAQGQSRMAIIGKGRIKGWPLWILLLACVLTVQAAIPLNFSWNYPTGRYSTNIGFRVWISGDAKNWGPFNWMSNAPPTLATNSIVATNYNIGTNNLPLYFAVTATTKTTTVSTTNFADSAFSNIAAWSGIPNIAPPNFGETNSFDASAVNPDSLVIGIVSGGGGAGSFTYDTVIVTNVTVNNTFNTKGKSIFNDYVTIITNVYITNGGNIYIDGTNVATVNPTDGFLPDRLNSSHFENSPLKRAISGGSDVVDLYNSGSQSLRLQSGSNPGLTQLGGNGLYLSGAGGIVVGVDNVTPALYFNLNGDKKIRWDSDGSGDIGVDGGNRPGHIYAFTGLHGPLIEGRKAFQAFQGTLTHAGSVTLDFDATATVNSMTLTGNCTFAFSNLATNRTVRVLLKNAQSTNCTLTLPGGTQGFFTGTLSNGWHMLSAESWGTVASNVWVSTSSNGTY